MLELTFNPGLTLNSFRTTRPRRVKALANENTLLRTHCCRHKCSPVFPRQQHLLRTHTNFASGTKSVSDFVQKPFVSATDVSQFAQPKKHHGQQCVRIYQGLNSQKRPVKGPVNVRG